MGPVYHFVKTRAGEYHSGIPARDLTEADLKGMTDEQRGTVEASPLYRRIERPPTATSGADDASVAGRAPAGKGGAS